MLITIIYIILEIDIILCIWFQGKNSDAFGFWAYNEN
jgi:hypothetical protein